MRLQRPRSQPSLRQERQPETESTSSSLGLALDARLLRQPSASSSSTTPNRSCLAPFPRLQTWPKPLPQRRLGIDIENGTRWGWGPNGYTHSIVYCTTIKWFGSEDDDVQVFWIDWRLPLETLKTQLRPMFKAMEEADAFIGHNFSHDFGGLSGLARDVGLPFPTKKPVIDTYKDIPKHNGASKSLEDLCLQFGLGDKPHLPQRVWVDAFIRNQPEAVAAVIDRNVKDVILTERLYIHERDELKWIT